MVKVPLVSVFTYSLSVSQIPHLARDPTLDVDPLGLS